MTAREFRAHRERLGMTQYEMARALDISQYTVYRLEHGQAGRSRIADPDRPVPHDLAKRARALRPQPRPSLRPTAEEVHWRRCIERSECPLCGRGRFRVLAQHTTLTHGVNARELRERAGLPLHASICDPEYAEEIGRTRRSHLSAIAGKGAARIREVRTGSRMPHSRGGALSRVQANRRRSHRPTEESQNHPDTTVPTDTDVGPGIPPGRRM